IDAYGNIYLVSDYFNSPEQVTTFLDETGLTEVFQKKQIKNLVDYVFGVEVGLDSNARKNRGGHIMEGLVANILTANGIPFEQEVYYTEFPEIVRALGADNKRFDFVIRTPQKVYLIEANFYTGGGSKLNEVARSYSELAPKINAVPGFEFVWITDGIGWESARNKLEEAFAHIPSVYNLTNINTFIEKLK
ncbi:type II restriction endonuclease, partial [uncultured Muribaculum sp.]